MEDCIDHGRVRSLSPEGYALVAKPGVRSRCVALHRFGVDSAVINKVVKGEYCVLIDNDN